MASPDSMASRIASRRLRDSRARDSGLAFETPVSPFDTPAFVEKIVDDSTMTVYRREQNEMLAEIHGGFESYRTRARKAVDMML